MGKIRSFVLLSLCAACQTNAPAHVVVDLSAWQSQAGLAQAGNITLSVAAPDLPTQTFAVPMPAAADPNGTLVTQLAFDVASGPARVFEVTAASPDNQVLYWGRKIVDLPSAATVSITLPAFMAGLLQGTAQLADGQALPAAVTLNIQALAPRPDAPASVNVAVQGGRLSQALPTGDYIISGQVTLGGVTYNISQRVHISAGQVTAVQLVLGAPLQTVAQLVFATQPVSAAAGTAQTVVVELRDGQNQRVSGASAAVTLQLLSGGQPVGLGLQGNTTVQASGGQATFDSLQATAAGTFTLRATVASASLPSVDSNAFTLVAGAPSALVAQGNATLAAGVPGTLQIMAVDAYSNPQLGLNAAIAASSSDPAAQFAPAALVNGAAALTMTFTGVGNKIVTLAAAGLSATLQVNVVAGPVASMAFLQQPTDNTACTPFSPPVQLQMRDAYGNLVTLGGVPVTLSLDPNSDPGVLRGQVQAAPNGGLLTFTDLNLPQAGNYTLVASAGVLLAQSQPFSINLPAPSIVGAPSVSGASGVLALNYTVADVCSRPVHMTLDWSPPFAADNVSLASPLNSGLSHTEGLDAVRTSPAGLAHTVAWETWKDLGRQNLSDLTLTFTAVTADQASSDPATLTGVSVTNALSALSLASTQSASTALNGAQSVAVADLDHNGSTDLVLLANGAVTLVLVNPTTGNLQNVGSFAATPGAKGLAVADFNQDGRPDVLVGNPNGGLALLLGAPGPTLAAAQQVPGTPVLALAAADFNMDGRPDVVTADGSSQLQVRNFDGSTFAPANTLSTGGSSMVAVAAVDLDLDSFADIVALDFIGGVYVEQNLAGSAFNNQNLSGGGNGVSLVVADVNGDAFADIVYGTDGGDVLQLTNQGAMSFDKAAAVGSNSGASILQLAVADIDRDGLGDLVSVTGNTLRLLSGTPGTLQDALTLDNAVGTLAVALADLNRDSKPDLVLVTATDVEVYDNTQTVVPGLPPQAHATRLTAAPQDDLALGELNGDGRIDAVVCTANALLIMLGDSDGLFSQSQSIGLTGGFSPIIADVDGNGFADVVLAQQGALGKLLFLPGLGDGTLGAAQPVTLQANTQAVKLSAADLNGDRLGDVAVVDNASNVQILLSQNGTLTLHQSVSVGPGPQDLGIVDFNQDGWLDLVTTNAGGSTGDAALSVLMGAANGQFVGSSQAGSVGNDRLALGDIDQDGFTDVVTSNHTANPNVYLWRAKGLTYNNGWNLDSTVDRLQLGHISYSSELEALVSNANVFAVIDSLSGSGEAFVTVNLPSNTRSLQLQDVNADGQGDVIAAAQGAQALVCWQASAGGQVYADPPSVSGSGQPTVLALANLDTDGRLDALMLDANTNQVWVAYGRGNGSFGQPAGYGIDAGAVDLAMGDLNNDGLPDALTANSVAQTLSVLTSQGVDGLYQDATISVGATPVAVAIGDVNNDGKQDVVTVTQSPNALGAALNESGSFTLSLNHSLSSSPTGLALGDMTQDGTLDAVVALANHSVLVLQGNGDGSFTQLDVFPTQHAPQHVVLADMNRDGQLDIVVSNPNDQSVSLLIVQGAQATLTDVTVGNGPQRVAVGDVNGDGWLDVVTACSVDQTVPLLLGDGHGGFLATPQMFVPDTAGFGVALGELNGDLRADVAVTQPLSARLSIFTSGYRRPYVP